MWVEANSKYKRYFTFRKASRSTILWICELTIDPFSLKTGRVVRRDNNTGALVNTTTLITIPALRILKCNDSSRFFSFSFSPHLKWKIEIFYAFSTLRIFHTLHFPHPSFSTSLTPHSTFSTEPWIKLVQWKRCKDPVIIYWKVLLFGLLLYYLTTF